MDRLSELEKRVELLEAKVAEANTAILSGGSLPAAEAPKPDTVGSARPDEGFEEEK